MVGKFKTWTELFPEVPPSIEPVIIHGLVTCVTGTVPITEASTLPKTEAESMLPGAWYETTEFDSGIYAILCYMKVGVIANKVYGHILSGKNYIRVTIYGLCPISNYHYTAD